MVQRWQGLSKLIFGAFGPRKLAISHRGLLRKTTSGSFPVSEVIGIGDVAWRLGFGEYFQLRDGGTKASIPALVAIDAMDDLE